MLRITTNAGASAEPTRLRLDGSVTGPWAAELRDACAEALEGNGRPRSLVLDLGGVSYLGPEGVALFRDLAARRVSFTNASAFVSEQLRGISDVER